MKWLQTTSMLIIAVGVISLVYGGISYFQHSPDVKVGDLELDVRDRQKDRRDVEFPIWLGVGCIIVGGSAYAYSSKN